MRHSLEHLLEENAPLERFGALLAENSKTLQRLFDQAPIGIGWGDLQGRFIKTNAALQQILACQTADLPHLDLCGIGRQADASPDRDWFRELVTSKREFYEREVPHRRADGQDIWVRAHYSLIRGAGKQPEFVLILLRDITEEKHRQLQTSAYQERLRSLAALVSLTEEWERRRLGNELEEHIGQMLALVQMQLGQLLDETDRVTARKTVMEIRALISQTLHAVRSLTFELSLPVLYDLGLESAVEWLAERFQNQYGLTIRVNRDGKAKPLGEAAAILIIQMLRELLANVVRHAQASEVQIVVSRESDHLHLEVADNGAGFEAAEAGCNFRLPHGFGLFTIKELLIHLGGNLQVRSRPGQGTLATLVVPLEKTASEVTWGNP